MSIRLLTVCMFILVLFFVAGCQNNDEQQTPLESPTLLEEATAVPDPEPTVTSVATETAVSPTLETPKSERTLLTYNQLMNGFNGTTPVAESAFAKPEEATVPEIIFEGRLELFDEETSGNVEVIRGDPDVGSDLPHLAEFDFAFVQSGDRLVPVQRGLIITDHPLWNYFLEPGQVWQEVGDQGYARASFPFAVVPKGGNSTYNGTMTFLFNEDGVSKVWYQITQETSFHFRANLWGLLDAEYHPEAVIDAEQVQADFVQELANRFPSKPIEQLALDYPDVDVSQFGADLSPEHLTAYGFVIDGVNYVSDCQTRYGRYTYCDSMRAPSWSTAKSAFASVALMRLAQKYNADVPNFLIKDYVPETAASSGDWSEVTFDHTLDMATGNYRSNRWMADEDDNSNPFWNDSFYDGKIAAAFNWPHSADPGTDWVYRTSDTFIVTRAMHNYLQTQVGPDADIYQFVVDEVYKPLRMGPGVFSTARTEDDNWQGQPYGGYGQWWVQDDIAKIATLLQNNGRLPDGEQLLHPDILAAAMQWNPDDRGVAMDSRSKYNNAFWATKYDQQDGYECEFWVPQMQGISGVVVVPMPNGSTYYYFSDNREFTWDTAVMESHKIASHCDL